MTWSYGWISPTRLMGLTGYALSLGSCTWAWVRSAQRGGRSSLFAVLAGVQAALLLDMAFDWRWKLHAYGMQTAIAEGVYGLRRSPQLAGLVALTGMAVFAAAVVLWRLRHRRGAALAMAGTVLSVGLWASEAISYHYLDLILYRRVGGVMMVAFLWLLLAGVTCFGVWKDLRDPVWH